MGCRGGMYDIIRERKTVTRCDGFYFVHHVCISGEKGCSKCGSRREVEYFTGGAMEDVNLAANVLRRKKNGNSCKHSVGFFSAATN